MSVRRMRSTDQMKSHSSNRNPTRVSCSTNPCIRRPSRPRPSATSRYLDSHQREREADSLYPCCDRPTASVDADDDLGVSETYHIAVSQLPVLNRCVVHGGAVRGVEIGQQCDLAVPADLQMPAGNAGVGQPELGVLAAADHVGAFAQLIGPPAAVVELEGDRGAACREVALPVAGAVATGRRRRSGVVVAAARGLAVTRIAVADACRLPVVLAAVVGLAVLLAAVLLTAAVALVAVAAALIGIGGLALVGVAAALVGIGGLRRIGVT